MFTKHPEIQILTGRESSWGTPVVATRKEMGVMDCLLKSQVRAKQLLDLRGSLTPAHLSALDSLQGGASVNGVVCYENMMIWLDSLLHVCTPTHSGGVYTWVFGSANADKAAASPIYAGGDLVGYWKLDETTGNRIDEQGNNDLVDVVGVGYTTGQRGNAAAFSPNDYMSAPDSVSLTITGSYTVCFWVRFNSITNDMTVVSKYDDTIGVGGRRREYLFSMGANQMTYRHSFDGNAYNVINSTTTFATDTWYHVVGRYNNLDGMYLFINGVQEAYQIDTIGSGTSGNDADFVVGAYNMIQSGGQGWLDGDVDDVVLYSSALSDAQIAAMYNELAGGALLRGLTLVLGRSAADSYALAGGLVSKLTISGEAGENDNELRYQIELLGKDIQPASSEWASLSDSTITPVMGDHIALYIDDWGNARGTTLFSYSFFSFSLEIDAGYALAHSLGLLAPQTYARHRFPPDACKLFISVEFDSAAKAYQDAMVLANAVFEKRVRIIATSGSLQFRIDFDGVARESSDIFTEKDGVLSVDFTLHGQQNGSDSFVEFEIKNAVSSL